MTVTTKDIAVECPLSRCEHEFEVDGSKYVDIKCDMCGWTDEIPLEDLVWHIHLGWLHYKEKEICENCFQNMRVKKED